MPLFGWRARLGFISPHRGRVHTSDLEMQMAAPDGVIVHSAYLDGPTSLTFEDLRAVEPQIIDAAREVTASTPMDVITMRGAPICLVNGVERVRDAIHEATGVPSTTVLDALVGGLRHVDASRIVVYTPYYPPELAALVREYFEDREGFKITAYEDGGYVDSAGHKAVSEHDTYLVAKRIFLRSPESDALLILGGGTPINSVLQDLETDIGVPVISNNFATLWNALRLAHVREPIHGYGRLLASF